MPDLLSQWNRVGPWLVHSQVSADAPAADAMPIVLVHGFGVSHRYWRPLARRLAIHHPVFAPDLPGHGRSDKPERALDVPGLRDALAAWMDELELARVALVGNSLGCQIAADLAARRPDRVSALVLCGPTVDPAARRAGPQILRLLLSAPAEYPWLGVILAGDYLRAGVPRLLEELSHMLRHPVAEVLPGVTARTLVLRGRWDRVVPRRWAVEVTRLLPEARLVEIAAAGHAAHYTRAGTVAPHILRFLAASS